VLQAANNGMPLPWVTGAMQTPAAAAAASNSSGGGSYAPGGAGAAGSGSTSDNEGAWETVERKSPETGVRRR
jgi:hypothetical protein